MRLIARASLPPRRATSPSAAAAPRIHALRLDAPPPRAIDPHHEGKSPGARLSAFPWQNKPICPPRSTPAASPAAASVRPQGTHPHQAAGRRDQAGRPPALPLAALAGIAAGRAVAGHALSPFPFQFEGVAFLYPRHAAVLADEMGLGKTMQAITAIRLLLRRGEVQSVCWSAPSRW